MRNSRPLQPVGQDQAMLRTVFGSFPSGVTAVCAALDGAPVGMAASSFTSVSMSPPLVSVCVQETSRTWQLLKRAKRLGVSVLSAGHESACRSLSMREGDRFSGVQWYRAAEDAVAIDGAAAVLVCSLYDELPAGDHTIALLRIHDVCADLDSLPLLYHRSGFHGIAVRDRD